MAIVEGICGVGEWIAAVFWDRRRLRSCRVLAGQRILVSLDRVAALQLDGRGLRATDDLDGGVRDDLRASGKGLPRTHMRLLKDVGRVRAHAGRAGGRLAAGVALEPGSLGHAEVRVMRLRSGAEA